MHDERRHTIIHQPPLHLVIYRDVRVVILWQIAGVVRDVQIDRIVAGFGDQVPVVLQRLKVSAPFATQRADRSIIIAHFESALLFRPIIHARSNHIPPSIHIRQIAAIRRTSRSQGELIKSAYNVPPIQGNECSQCTAHHDRRYRHQGIIHSPGLIYVPRLKRDLQAAASHTERHRVHVDVRGIAGRFGGCYWVS